MSPAARASEALLAEVSGHLHDLADASDCERRADTKARAAALAEATGAAFVPIIAALDWCDEAAGLLARLEWAAASPPGACPACHASPPTHDQGCALARLLRSASAGRHRRRPYRELAP